MGDELATASPADGAPPGSSYELARRAGADAQRLTQRALLLFDRAMFAASHPNPFYAAAVVRAINDWNADRWLARDQRLFGTALIPEQEPDKAVAELDRVAANPKIAAVTLSPSIGRLLGHPLYNPIYEAAASLGLPGSHPPWDRHDDRCAYRDRRRRAVYVRRVPVARSAGADVKPDEPGHQRRLRSLSIVALLCRGWRRRSTSRPCCCASIPCGARFAVTFRGCMSHRARTSSGRSGSAPTGSSGTRRTRFAGCARPSPVLQRLLIYASGYPSWDTVWPEEVEQLIPVDWRSDVLNDNAEAWFRWQGPGPSSAAGRGCRHGGRGGRVVKHRAGAASDFEAGSIKIIELGGPLDRDRQHRGRAVRRAQHLPARAGADLRGSADRHFASLRGRRSGLGSRWQDPALSVARLRIRPGRRRPHRLHELQGAGADVCRTVEEGEVYVEIPELPGAKDRRADVADGSEASRADSPAGSSV